MERQASNPLGLLRGSLAESLPSRILSVSTVRNPSYLLLTTRVCMMVETREWYLAPYYLYAPFSAA